MKKHKMEMLENNAIEMLNLLCGNSAFVVSDSGGKDSSIIKHIALKTMQKYGTQFRVQHNLTTVDAPGTVYFIKAEKERFEKMGIRYDILYPKRSMWQLIVDYGMPPTRRVRYCCAELKEYSGHGEKLVTGVRKAESKNRKDNQGIVTFPKPIKELEEKVKDNENFIRTDKGGVVLYNLDNAESRRIVETCYRTSKTLINPLIDWDDEFVWWYIRHENIQICPEYQNGNCRLGCIGCPMAGKQRWKHFALYPKYKENYIRAFERMIQRRKEKGLEVRSQWATGKKVFKWWMEDDSIDGQLVMDFYGNIREEYT